MLSKLRREFLRLMMKTAIKHPLLRCVSCIDNAVINWNLFQKNYETQYSHPDISTVVCDDNVKILDLSCTSGFGETVHPDVLYVPNGWGCGKWKYLMSITPFPRGAEYFENPEFLVSYDGIEWHIPEGVNSPLVAAPYDWLGYNSDPSLFLDDGKLYMLYRDFRENAKNAALRILLISSDDGIRWSEPAVIMECSRPRKDVAVMMSPSVLKINGEYIMWYVSSDSEGRHRIYRRVSCDLSTWSQEKLTELFSFPSDEEPWHLDVAECGCGVLIMALCSFQKDSYRQKRITFAKSSDGGFSWNFTGNFIEPGYSGFGKKSLYRPSLSFDEAKNEWLMYYSGQDLGNHWYTAVTSVNQYI